MQSKVLSLLLVVLMVFTFIPVISIADDGSTAPPVAKDTVPTPAAIEIPTPAAIETPAIPAAITPTAVPSELKLKITTSPGVDFVITTSAISGVTVPVTGATPVATLAGITEYNAAIAWSGAPAAFDPDIVYTATITLTPKAGYTLIGVPANFFTVAGAVTTNATDSGIVTAAFPKTMPLAPQLVGAATSSNGDKVTLTFSKAMADPPFIPGGFTVEINGIEYYDSPVSQALAISSVTLNLDSSKTMIDLNMAGLLQRGDIVTVSYEPGTVSSADGALLGAFADKPVTNTIPVVIDTNLQGTWQIFDHVGNWQEAPFISPIYDDPRGNSFNRHIVIAGSSIYFFGNGVHPFKDFLYLPSAEAAAKSFTFNLDLGGIKYHSMEGGGFLFNTIISSNLLSGYCVLFTNNSGFAAELYQLDGIDVNKFHEGQYPYSNNFNAQPSGIRRIGKYPITGNIHTIILECSSESVDLWDGSTKLIDNVALPKAYSNGVGIIGSYQSHDCSQLSYFVFSSLNIQGIADCWATLVGEDQANLTFTKPEGATSVTVEQSLDGVNWSPSVLTAPINQNSTAATVTGLQKYKTYYFRLVIKDGKYDGYSRIGTATYTVRPITDLKATGGNGTVSLTFTPPEDGPTILAMQSTNGGKTWVEATLAAPLAQYATSATVIGLTNGQQYSFKVVVSAEVGGGDSNIVNATPGTPAPIVITAVSAPAEATHTHILTVAKTGEGSVLPDIGTHEYVSGSTVQLTAIPAVGYSFKGWLGTTGETVYIDDNKTVTAVFEPTIIVVTPTVVPAGSATSPEAPSTEAPGVIDLPTGSDNAGEVVAEEETVPAGPGDLPGTGGLPGILLYSLGGVLAASGLYLRRKMK